MLQKLPLCGFLLMFNIWQRLTQPLKLPVVNGHHVTLTKWSDGRPCSLADLMQNMWVQILAVLIALWATQLHFVRAVRVRQIMQNGCCIKHTPSIYSSIGSLYQYFPAQGHWCCGADVSVNTDRTKSCMRTWTEHTQACSLMLLSDIHCAPDILRKLSGKSLCLFPASPQVKCPIDSVGSESMWEFDRKMFREFTARGMMLRTLDGCKTENRLKKRTQISQGERRRWSHSTKGKARLHTKPLITLTTYYYFMWFKLFFNLMIIFDQIFDLWKVRKKNVMTPVTISSSPKWCLWIVCLPKSKRLK